jgi:nitrate reductase gamma subunit
VHVLVAMLLFAAWPFTRLVHAFTAPFHYLFRPYIVYRSRDVGRPGPGSGGATPGSGGSRPPRRGWAPVGTRDRD